MLFDDTRQCVIIDPGCYERYEEKQLSDFIQAEQLTVTQLLNTHGHVDHVLGNAFVKRTYRVPLAIHRTDEQTLRAVQAYAPAYGFMRYEPAEPDHFLAEGETVTWGESTLSVLFVPGHAPGHIAFYHEAGQFCIGGDVLFRGSIGRTDLPGGNFDTLVRSIREKMYTLPDDTIVYSGHGRETTIGYEKKHNPFVQPE